VEAADKATRIEELMRAYQGYDLFNGSVLVAEGEEVIYKRGLGWANREWRIENDASTRFRLGSITKQFTAALILQLVEEKKLKLEATVSDYFPSYRKDTGQRVTLHHLLTHTSGIPSYTAQPDFMKEVSRDPYGVEEFAQKYCSGDLEFEPGSRFLYNNSGYFLLGAIVEKIAGKPYEEVLRERILEPLEMKSTGYDHHQTVLEKRASGYERTLDGWRNAPYLDMSIPYAAGSLYSTVEDLFLWDQGLYWEAVLSDSSRKLMFTPFLSQYAYGWRVEEMPVGDGPEKVSMMGHGGGINGFNTLLLRLAGEGRTATIVLLNNTGPAPLQEISRQILRILYDKPYQLPKKPLAEVLYRELKSGGVEAALGRYRELKSSSAEVFDFGERALDRLGRHLLEKGWVADAIRVLEMNAQEFPRSALVHDSLGAAYREAGQRELAIKSFEKSLELEPDNPNASATLKQLKQP